MKITTLLTVAASVFEAQAPAASTNAPAPIRISAAQAAKHIDESVIVTGKVAQVTLRPKVVFLNLDKPHPDSPFTAIIFSKDTNGFGDLKSLEGKSVEISGKIKEFKDAPEIVIAGTNQLTVLTHPPAPAKK